MKAKVSRVLLALLMTATLLIQLMPIQTITAYAESTSSAEVLNEVEKRESTDQSQNDPVESTRTSDQNNSNDSSSVGESEKTIEHGTVESKQEDLELDSSIYGSGAGVPGERSMVMTRASLSPDLPTFFGISTDAIVKELQSHETDGFYVGTPYRGLYTNPDEANYLSPNGAPTSYGPGMNCTGFIATVIKRAGGDISRITNNSTGFGGAANAYNWRDVLSATTYADTFNSISEMLASGTMRKGDIIYFEPDKTVTNFDCHVGFFWGNSPSENKFWHSYDPGGNIISEIKAKSPSEKIYVFHNAKPKTGKVLLKKTDDSGKSLAGAEFNLIAEGKTTKSTTNSNGELTTPDYKVGTVVKFEETKAPDGHYIDPATSKGSITITEGTNTIKVTNPRFANLTLIKKNDKGKSLEGATFKLSYLDKVETLKSNKDGQLSIKGLKAGTKVDWEEIATIVGHYIPENAKGSIVVKSGENTITVNNPTLKFDVSSQASNQDGAQFVNPTQHQKLRDEVLIEAKQAPTNAKLRLTTDFVEFGTGEQLGEESLKQVTEFEAKQAKFVKNVYLDFDATNLHGKKGVFTNLLEYYNPSTKAWEVVGRHDDLNNEAESIQFVSPKIHTEVFFYDQNNKETHLIDPLKKVKGYDRVYYEHLISGQTYTFDLTMMSRETGKEFKDSEGKTVSGTLEVVAGKDGNVTAKVNAKEYYAQLAESEQETAPSEEVAETPTTRTEAPTADTTETSEEATEFSTLNEVDLLTGNVDVPFEVNLSAAKSKELVAFEQVTTDETVVAEHKDLKDDKQTGKVRNPKIGTKALVNGKTEVTTDGKVTLTDEIAYEDLTPNVEYEASLVWMDARTKQPVKINGKELASTLKFTPKEATGTVTVTINDVAVQELFGKDSKFSLVAFEEVTSKGEKIAEHKDIKDKGQTITVVKPIVPATPATPTRTLPQTSGTLGNPFVWLAVVLVLAAGAFFVLKNQKQQEK